MPLLPGKQNVGKNIQTEVVAGKPRKQAIAIALNVAGGSKPKRRPQARKHTKKAP